MKIATLGNAGVVHVQRWADWFRARGHDVRVWSLEPPPPGFAALPLPRAPLPGFLRYPLATAALRRALDAFDPDLVDAHFVPNYGLLGALAHGRRPLSVTAWGSDLLVTGRRDPLQAARARFVLRRADLVIADAENLAAAARELGARPERVLAMPWGIELERFERLPPREPGLLFSARMHEPVYDLPAVIEGAAAVIARHPGARLVIAGDGSLRPALETLARKHIPEGRVAFVGMLDARGLAEWLGRADVYVSASRSDSTSVTLLEAMAAGAVPVVSDIPGNREWVADGDGAATFPPGDAAALSRATERVLADPAAADAMRARNRRVVAERGCRSVNLGRIEQRFGALVAGGRGR